MLFLSCCFLSNLHYLSIYLNYLVYSQHFLRLLPLDYFILAIEVISVQSNTTLCSSLWGYSYIHMCLQFPLMLVNGT